jgi:hypothetical protein
LFGYFYSGPITIPLHKQYRGFTFKHVAIDVADVDGDVIDDDDCREKNVLITQLGMK